MVFFLEVNSKYFLPVAKMYVCDCCLWCLSSVNNGDLKTINAVNVSTKQGSYNFGLILVSSTPDVRLLTFHGVSNLLWSKQLNQFQLSVMYNGM